MASKQAIERLKKELKRLQKEPVQYIEAVPDEGDLLTWHYCITGPADSIYAGGTYHGKVVFPKQYPFKPPTITMITPSGRFKTNTPLCLSMSSFHPESWNPLWNVGSILNGVLSFMLESTQTYGSVESTDEQKRIYAANSLAYNLKDAKFCSMFPHYQQKDAYEQQMSAVRANIQAQKATATATSAAQPSTTTTTDGSTATSTNASSAVDTRPLLNDNNQPADNAVREAPRPNNNGVFDKVVIVLVILTIAFLLSYLYV